MATVNTNTKALTNLVDTKNQLIKEAQSNYNKASQGATQKYNELIQASKDYGEKQAEIQQAQTDQTINEINQNKERTERDYTKEQKAAYADYANQTNEYGTNAEKMAAQGLLGSGYQESSKVSMYNTYQNRVATARESYNDAIQNYDNQITQARLANSSALAEIAYNSLKSQLELSLEGLQYQNELLQNLTNTKLNVSTSYDQLWQSMYNTLLDESQFNEQMKYQKQRDKVEDSHWQKEYALSVAAQKSRGSRKSGSSSGGNTLVPKDNSNSNKSSGDTLERYVQGVISSSAPKAVKQAQLSILVKQNQLTQGELNKLLSAN